MCLGFGIYHSKDEFLQKSLSVVHPFDSMCPLKDELLKVLFNIATMGPLWVVEQRKTTLSKWLIFAKDLGAQEKVLTMTLAVSENKFQDIQMISYGTCIASQVLYMQLTLLPRKTACFVAELTVNLVSIDVSGAEARTGLMCTQCSSVMNRTVVQDDDSEWERIADSREVAPQDDSI